MKWNTPILWLFVGFSAGVGTYAVWDKSTVLQQLLNESECQRFDRRCATLNVAGTHWVGSSLCNLSGIMIQKRTEEKCAKLNAKLDDVMSGSEEAPEDLGSGEVLLKNWTGRWDTTEVYTSLHLTGELENPPSSSESYEDVTCEAVVTIHYKVERTPYSKKSSFLCGSIHGLTKGETANLKDRQALFFKNSVTDYPVDRVSMTLTLRLKNPFGQQFQRNVPALDLPIPPNEQKFALPID